MIVKTHLYKNGDECTSITGGFKDWDYGSGGNYSRVNIVKNSDHILMKPNASNKRCTFITNNKINLTKYKNLVFELELVNEKDSNEWGGFGIIVDNTKYEYKTTNNTFSPRVVINISSETGEFYIGNHIICGGYAESPFIEYKIKEIYLEEEVQGIDSDVLSEILDFGEEVLAYAGDLKVKLYNLLKDKKVEVTENDNVTTLIDAVAKIQKEQHDFLKGKDAILYSIGQKSNIYLSGYTFNGSGPFSQKMYSKGGFKDNKMYTEIFNNSGALIKFDFGTDTKTTIKSYSDTGRHHASCNTNDYLVDKYLQNIRTVDTKTDTFSTVQIGTNAEWTDIAAIDNLVFFKEKSKTIVDIVDIDLKTKTSVDIKNSENIYYIAVTDEFIYLVTTTEKLLKFDRRSNTITTVTLEDNKFARLLSNNKNLYILYEGELKKFDKSTNTLKLICNIPFITNYSIYSDLDKKTNEFILQPRNSEKNAGDRTTYIVKIFD